MLTLISGREHLERSRKRPLILLDGDDSTLEMLQSQNKVSFVLYTRCDENSKKPRDVTNSGPTGQPSQPDRVSPTAAQRPVQTNMVPSPPPVN
jgi:hypothetical protein